MTVEAIRIPWTPREGGCHPDLGVLPRLVLGDSWIPPPALLSSAVNGNNAHYPSGLRGEDRLHLSRTPHSMRNINYFCYCGKSQRPGRTFCSRGKCTGRLWTGIKIGGAWL